MRRKTKRKSWCGEEGWEAKSWSATRGDFRVPLKIKGWGRKGFTFRSYSWTHGGCEATLNETGRGAEKSPHRHRFWSQASGVLMRDLGYLNFSGVYVKTKKKKRKRKRNLQHDRQAVTSWKPPKTSLTRLRSESAGSLPFWLTSTRLALTRASPAHSLTKRGTLEALGVFPVWVTANLLMSPRYCWPTLPTL